MIWVVISPVLIILVRSRVLFDPWLVSLWHLHHLHVFIHVYGVRLPPFGELVEINAFLVNRPDRRVK